MVTYIIYGTFALIVTLSSIKVLSWIPFRKDEDLFGSED